MGGVSERPAPRPEGPSLRESSGGRGGGRHPGLPEGGVLRGASSERRPRSARRTTRLSPRAGAAPMTADVRRSPRRGTPSACAISACTPWQARVLPRRTRPSLGPSTRARQSSLHTAAQASVVRRSIRYRGWANRGHPKEPAVGSVERASRGSPRVTAPLEGEGVARQKRKEIEVSVPARIKSSGLVARTSLFRCRESVGGVWPQVSSANAPQKGRPGSSERGPSSTPTSAGDAVGGGAGRRDDRESASP